MATPWQPRVAARRSAGCLEGETCRPGTSPWRGAGLGTRCLLDAGDEEQLPRLLGAAPPGAGLLGTGRGPGQLVQKPAVLPGKPLGRRGAQWEVLREDRFFVGAGWARETAPASLRLILPQ